MNLKDKTLDYIKKNNTTKIPKFKKLPKHVAMILDGNGRWAKERGLSRSKGHRAGGENLDSLIDAVLEIGIPNISLFAFSTENWKRPPSEIKELWNLLSEFFETRLKRCLNLGVKVMTSGDISRLPQKTQNILEEIKELTKKNKNLIVNFCVNYGSQFEILRACNLILEKKILKENLLLKKKNNINNINNKTQKISLKEFEKHLYTYGLPPVDLLVRTGGEMRLSNFMLWQAAYSEIYITNTFFPDFDLPELIKALVWFSTRNRRFGDIK